MRDIHLTNPAEDYRPRLIRTLKMARKLRRLSPRDRHLWQVMDSVAFADTETALETALYNATRPESHRNQT